MRRWGVLVAAASLAACDTAGLRPLQAEVTVRYDALRTSLSPAAHDSLRAGQDLWVAFWPRACDRDGGDSLTFACARTRFQDRLALLESSDEIALGVRTYPKSVYRVVPSAADGDAFPTAVIEWQRVGLDAKVTNERERALLDALQAWLDTMQGTLVIDSVADLRVDRTLRRTTLPGILVLKTRRERVDHRTGVRAADTSYAHFSIDAAQPISGAGLPATDLLDARRRR